MKNTIIDIVICVLCSIAIIVEIVFGFNVLKSKWAADTTAIISKSTDYGKSVGLVETVFKWPDAPEPDTNGDVVAIGENKFKIDGIMTDDTSNSGYIYFSDAEDSSSKFVQYEEVRDSDKLMQFKEALTSYFNEDITGLVNLLPITTTVDEVTAYQQNFTDGAIPVLYANTFGNYYLYLDCGSSYYLLTCTEPFIITDASVSVHYASISEDPLTQHSWSTYEAGAIDNTRQRLSKDKGVTNSYTQSAVGNNLASTPNTQPTNNYVDQAGNTYTGASDIQTNNDMYRTQADDDMRQLLASYGSMEFDEEGNALDGSGSIDIDSVAAKSSEWLLTESQYAFTDEGITINGLSGKRTATTFTISGNVNNTVNSARPWVLVVKFMAEDNKLLGVKVLDNRSDPIPASDISHFAVSLDSTDNIDFSRIVAIQFAIH